MRRRILDLLRRGQGTEASRLLDAMDHIYSTLVTFDFADQITGGLRRRTDALRAVFERTHGDLSNNFRSAQLKEALKALEAKLTESEAGRRAG
jgi:translin